MSYKRILYFMEMSRRILETIEATPRAEAKKAEGASWCVLVIPNPPLSTGSDARETFRIHDKQLHRSSSKM